MTLDPLLLAPPAVQVHVLAAGAAVLAAPVALLRRSRDRLHRLAGWLFVTGMAAAALSSFLILEQRMIGPLSPIHALSVLALIGLWRAIRAIRRGDVPTHRAEMRGLAFYALGLPALLTLLPGRRLSATLFPAAPLAGFLAAAALFALVWMWLRWRQQVRVKIP